MSERRRFRVPMIHIPQTPRGALMVTWPECPLNDLHWSFSLLYTCVAAVSAKAYLALTFQAHLTTLTMLPFLFLFSFF